MKKVTSLLLVFVLFFCSSVGIYAESGNERTVYDTKAKMLADRFFADSFAVYDSNGADITAEFYAAITPKYQNMDYMGIAEYFMEYAKYAECISVEPASPLRSSRDTVTVTRGFVENVDDLRHGWENHNIIHGTVSLTYVVNSNEGEILSARKPSVVDIDLFHHYGDLIPEIEVSGKTAEISSDRQSATFSFDVYAFMRVYSEIYPEAGDMNLAYEYEASFSFTEYAP